MNKLLGAILGFCLAASPMLADGHASGDALAGEKVFRKCKACHSIVNAEDDVIVKGGRNGPNLYNLYTRIAGSLEGFKYGKSIVAAGQAGLAWNEADFMEYAVDSKKFLRAYLDDSKARSNMGFKLKKNDDRANVWAFLVSVGSVTPVEAAATSD